MGNKKLGKILYDMLLVGFIIFPIVCALATCKDVFLQMDYKRFSIQIVVFLFCIVLFSFLILKKAGMKIEIENKNIQRWLAGLLALISLSIKYFMITVMGNNIFQNSEYGVVYRFSAGIESTYDLEHVSVFPHWSLVGFINKFFMKVFHNNSITFFQLINALLLSLAVIMVYYISLEIKKNVLSAFLGGLIFAVAPTENIYFLLLSNEFIAILSFLLIITILLKYDFFIRKIDSCSAKIILVILLGIAFFILKFSKPIGKVFVVALVIVTLLKFLIFQHKNWTQQIGILISVVVLSLTLSNIYVGMLTRYTDVPINEDMSPHFLTVGLYSKYWEIGNVYEKLIMEEDFQYDVVNKRYREMIKKDLRENITKIPEKLKENFKEEWQDYKNGLRMALNRFGEDNRYFSLFNAEGMSVWGGVLTQVFYMLVLSFAIVSVLWMLLFEKECRLDFFFVCLLCFGVALGLMFGEPQERYKCIIMPLLYLLAGDGIKIALEYCSVGVEKIGVCIEKSGIGNKIMGDWFDVSNEKIKFHTIKKRKKVKDSLYIVIPAYNEEKNIKKVVEDWYLIIEKIEGKLIVIDDGSKDNTYSILQQLQKKYPKLVALTKENSGHGATCLFGYQYAIEQGADYIFQTDSDGQTLSQEFWGFWEQRKNYDMVIGWRNSREDGFSRVIVTKVLKVVIKICFGETVTDANTPFRLMNRRTLERYISVIPKDYNLSNVLISVIYAKKKLAVKYIPITFHKRQAGKNSIDLKKIIRIGKKAVKDFVYLNKVIESEND